MGGKREIRSRRRVQSEATPQPQSALQKPQKRSIKTKDAYLKIQAAPAPATPPSALQQGKASFVQERQGTLLRSGKLDRRLPAGEDVPSAAPPSGKQPQGMDIHKQPRQVSGQAGGSRVQSKPHRETPRQAMGGTAKTAVKERGAPVKQAAHPVRKTAGIGKPSGKPPSRAFSARQARRTAEAGARPERTQKAAKAARVTARQAAQAAGRALRAVIAAAKALVIGWDSRWGQLTKVWADGNSTTDTYRPYGLDCSGFVDWVFYNVTGGEYVIGHGGGAHMQHTCCTPISWNEAQPGDLVFYPDDEHVGIVGGRDESGNMLIIHCAFSQNNVVITGLEGFTSIGHPLYYGE